MKTLTRKQFEEILETRILLLCWAGLYERQDFFVEIGGQKKPLRDITNEPNHWHRAIKRESK